MEIKITTSGNNYYKNFTFFVDTKMEYCEA